MSSYTVRPAWRGILALALVVSALSTLLVSPARAADTISLSPGSIYTQDFNTLASSGTANTAIPAGWSFSESGTNANSTYRAGTGSDNTGDTYSFGAAGIGERAFGGLRSGSVVPLIGVSFINNTGAPIEKLTISYTGEQWRLGQNTLGRPADRLDFQLSTSATSLTTGTWADYNDLDFTSPTVAGSIGALDGNAAANRTALSLTISGLTIASGASFWIRWADTDLIPGADDGLSVDDFSLTAGEREPVINEFSASTAGTDVEYVEIFGSPNTDYSAYSVLEIEGDAGTALGTVDEVIALGTTDASGLLLLSLPANALENGTLTLLLVKDFTGALNSDLDADNNGVADATLWSAIADAVAVNDGGTGDQTYGAPALGVAYDGAPFAPGGASRIPDGTDTDTSADWVRNDFDLAGIPGFTGSLVTGEAVNTPGATNQAFTADSNLVSVEASDGDASEAGSATGSFRISRSGNTSAALNVSYTLGGTASPADYTPTLGGSVSIPAGAASVDIVIAPVDDAEVEGPETLTLSLAAGANYLLGASASAAITIADNDAALVITKISAIQGSGAAAAVDAFTVEAIVVGDYQTQGSGQLRGFFIQEEDADADADAATSEGIFVFCGACPVDVAVGDKVRVSGTSSEFFGMSQLSATTSGSVSRISAGNPLPSPATIELPIPGVPSGDVAAATAAINAYFEPFEGMLVAFPDTLAVSEYFELARYGQVILSEGGRPRTFTDANAPSAAGLINHEIDLARRSVILDDTDNRQNRPSDTPNTAYYHPVPGLSTGNFFRGGDTITNLTGVLHWSFAGQQGTDAWRIRPVVEAFNYGFTSANPRPAAPAVGGSLKVASFNVLNYFLTVDTTSSNDVGSCGASTTLDCRGADSAQELQRQRTKLLAALEGLDADVLGLIEMENTPGVEPLADIVAGLPGYDYVDTGVTGSDAIRVGIIYNTASVAPVGDYAVLDSQAFVNPRNAEIDRNRPALAQTFEEKATGARFTVVVNHLKSKGSGCGTGDDDTSTGQGNCNLTRSLAAQELARWLATDPTGSGDSDVLIIGDLNSYAKEDPITALKAAGYTDLVAAFGGPSAYSYVFDGQLGYLDHALSNTSLTPQVADVAEWHINADEIPLFDYNDEVRDPGERDAFEEESDALPLYEPDEFRTSDHDPVIVGLNLNAAPTVAASFGPAAGCGVASTLSGTISDPNANDSFTAVVDWGDGSAPESVTVTDRAFSASHTYAKAGSYTATVTVADSFGESATAEAETAVTFTVVGGGLLQPINQDGSSVFRYGSTIPVKLRLQDCDGSFPANLAPTIKLTQLSGSAPGSEINEPVSTGNGDSGNVLRYDAASQQYIFNLATKPLPDPTATYEITITVPATKQTVKATFGLR